jgi:hypothetical protein
MEYVPTIEEQQDAMRPFRQFVGLLNSAVNEQSWAGADGQAVNVPYQYQTIGRSGAAVEGSAVSTNAQGEPQQGIPMGLLLFVGLAYLVLK